MAPARCFDFFPASALLAPQVGTAPAQHLSPVVADVWSELSAVSDEEMPSSESCSELFSRLDLPSSRSERLRRSRGRAEADSAERRRRVDARLLCTEIPNMDDQLEAEEARAAIAAAAAAPPPGPAEKQASPGVRLTWGPRSREWDNFLEAMRSRHEWRVMKALGERVDIAPVYPEEQVQKRFLRNLREVPGSIAMCFHGSKKANFESIARRGLIVPGNSGIKIANGQAHGKGIYVATLDNPALSQGFSCDSRSIFVCAICDTTAPLEDSRKEDISSAHVMSWPARKKQAANWNLSRFRVKAVSDEILHIGQAMVISQERFVVPLFLATVPPERNNSSRICWEPPQQVGTRRVAMPDDGDAGISFAVSGRTQLGRTVWLPPQPAQGLSSRVKDLKRREVRRTLDKVRRQDRDRKIMEFEDELGCTSDVAAEEML